MAIMRKELVGWNCGRAVDDNEQTKKKDIPEDGASRRRSKHECAQKQIALLFVRRSVLEQIASLETLDTMERRRDPKLRLNNDHRHKPHN